MNKIEFEKNISQIWIGSRSDSGKSQEYVAQKLGVSKRTIQNWEAGEAFPNFKMAVEWFRILGLPMYPYLMDALYPSQMRSIKKDQDLNSIRSALHTYIDELDDMRAMELLFCLRGGHGSSPTGTIDLCTAYLSLPLPIRVSLASTTLINYEIMIHSGKHKDHAHPSIETLKRYIETAKIAVMNGKDSYIFEEDT